MRRRLLAVRRVGLPKGETLRGPWVPSSTWGSSLSLNSYEHREEMSWPPGPPAAAAPLLQPHLMADVSCELNQTVFHRDVSASGDVLPSAADLTDFSE